MTGPGYDAARNDVIDRAQQLLERVGAEGSLDAALTQLGAGISEFERVEDAPISVLLGDDTAIEGFRRLGSTPKALARAILCVDSRAREAVRDSLETGLPAVATVVLLVLVKDEEVLAGTTSIAASITAIACARELDAFCAGSDR